MKKTVSTARPVVSIHSGDCSQSGKNALRRFRTVLSAIREVFFHPRLFCDGVLPGLFRPLRYPIRRRDPFGYSYPELDVSVFKQVECLGIVRAKQFEAYACDKNSSLFFTLTNPER